MSWEPVCEVDAVGDSTGVAVTWRGLPLALFRDGDGSVHAVEDRCPHQGTPLSSGAISNGSIVCPKHGWRFDPATGERFSMSGPVPGIHAYPCRIVDGWVEVGDDGESETAT